MKKIAFLLVALAAVFMIAGCSSSSDFGATGNPSELTGTWNAAEKSTSDLATVAGTNEGTWTLSTTTNPTPASSATSAGVTTITWYDPTTETETGSATIAANGSYTSTYTYASVRPARDAAPADTATTEYVGYWTAAVTAYSYTQTTVKTSTVTVNADKSYQEEVATAITTTVVSAGVETKTTTSSSVTNTNLSKYSLSFTNYTGWTQTAATNDYDLTKNDVSDTAYSLVITADGAYTWTSTYTKTRTAPAAGTAKATIVETGTVTGANDSSKVVTFSRTSTKVDNIGTGSLISVTYPETASTVTYPDTSSKVYSYYVTKGTSDSYLGIYYDVSGSTTSLPVYTLAK
jgi:hypothetical protein